MKYFSVAVILTASSIWLTSCNKSDDLNYLYPDSTATIKYQLDWQKNFYFTRIKEFKEKPIGKNKIVFLGNSITYGLRNWNGKFDSKNIINRGISGDYSDAILKRLDEIIFYKPLAVFFMIGVNDFFDDNTSRPNRTPKYVAKNILDAAKRINKGSPRTKIFIQTILPINNQQYLDQKPNIEFLWPSFYPSVNQQINETNKILANNGEFKIIDVHSLFLDNNSELKRSLSSDGVHLNKNGYNIWIDTLIPFLNSIKTIEN